MVDSGDVGWDVCDADGYSAIRLGRTGALSAIDYSIIDRSLVTEPFAFDHGVGGYTYAYVLAYDTELYKDHPPQSWADFWDLTRFPGNRGIWRWMNGGFEAAMLSAGAARNKVYPIDLALVMDRMKQLRPNLQTWESGAQSKQMLIDRVVGMSCIWHSRAVQLAAESKGRIAWTWADGILYPGVWVVPKNNPAGSQAFKFIASMQDAQRQINFTGLQGVGPCNPAATKAMPANLRAADPTQPENRARLVTVDSAWWADNYDLAMKRFQDFLEQP
jgi:putative spermidine/putrescine transport system substrate-binding protein